ncbi:MAG: site-specific DNA-methyltransferase [Eubacterium sp.]|nr:site-specific DNA-methyltransferase [Eubacterium sp.]
MGLLRDLNRIYRSGKSMYKRSMKAAVKELYLREEISGTGLIKKNPGDNILVLGDNRNVMRCLLSDDKYSGKINLIYVDPPFFSMADYDAVLQAGNKNLKHAAYKDNWSLGMSEYLKMLVSRLFLMRELLSENGVICIHLDWHAVHYARIILDEIFGSENFVNEIIWNYKSGGSTNKRFSRKHDNILIYSKSKKFKFKPQKEKSYNRGYKPYRFKGVEEFQDELGWYTLVNMKDVWQIDMVGRTSAERTGYATQKPEQLINRIIEAFTDEGDLVADFFCGSGTVGSSAAKLRRNFVMVDSGKLAVATSAARLIKNEASFTIFDSQRPKTSSLKSKVNISVDRDDTINIDAVKVELESIRLNRAEKEINANEIDKIKNLLSENPLSLILSWSIDFDYDGKVHRPEVIEVRDGSEFKTGFSSLKTTRSPISVKITDIFGNVEYKVYEI